MKAGGEAPAAASSACSPPTMWRSGSKRAERNGAPSSILSPHHISERGRRRSASTLLDALFFFASLSMAPPLSLPPQQETRGRRQTQRGSCFKSFLVIFLSALRGLVERSHFVLKGNVTWHQAPPLKGTVCLKSFASPTPNRYRSICPGARRAQPEGRPPPWGWQVSGNSCCD